MEFFKPGVVYDFMRVRVYWIALSIALVVASSISVFYPGPNYGTDFRGGTEVELAFLKPIDIGKVRQAVEQAGFTTPDVVQVVDPKSNYHFLIRVQDVTAINEKDKEALRRGLCYFTEGEPVDEARCPKDVRATEVKFSLGGDKIDTRYDVDPCQTPTDPEKLAAWTLEHPSKCDLSKIVAQVRSVQGVTMRTSDTNPVLLNARDHHVEIQLQSKGDQLIESLQKQLGPEMVPDRALRVEWVGPKAGKQLRDSARNAVAIAIVFIMLYLAFRFDLRFAPGVVVACIHDAMVVLGGFVLLRKEVTLSTIAAVLTVVGYSMNDTVVVYDRIRENLSKHRGRSFAQIINLSVSETLSRTILTSGATMLSMVAFFIWGTGVIKDFALAMVIGIVAGTYSSIYVAAPLTEWIDHQLAKRGGAKRIAAHGAQKG
jgi:preprotein translocase subunit SecF